MIPVRIVQLSILKKAHAGMADMDLPSIIATLPFFRTNEESPLKRKKINFITKK